MAASTYAAVDAYNWALKCWSRHGTFPSMHCFGEYCETEADVSPLVFQLLQVQGSLMLEFQNTRVLICVGLMPGYALSTVAYNLL